VSSAYDGFDGESPRTKRTCDGVAFINFEAWNAKPYSLMLVAPKQVECLCLCWHNVSQVEQRRAEHGKENISELEKALWNKYVVRNYAMRVSYNAE
jgi:hypothetical protein